MKAYVIYDSIYGNTEKIARAIGKGIGDMVQVVSVNDVNMEEMKNMALLVLGSPTHGGRPTPKITEFIRNIPATAFSKLHIAAFDTRADMQSLNTFLRALINFIGYAAPKILKLAERKQATVVSPPMGFAVGGKEGPLRKGELERAQEWGRQLTKNVHSK